MASRSRLPILIAAIAAGRWLRSRGLEVEPISTIAALAALGGIVGAGIFYVFEHDPGALITPSRLFSSRGFTV